MLLKRNKLKISEKLTTPFRSSLSPLQTPSSEGGIEIVTPRSDSDENREIQMKKCKKLTSVKSKDVRPFLNHSFT